MADTLWTKEQEQAIQTLGNNILVSAAAGSGKTAVLTERLKELILNKKTDCSRLLVLTFTRAAAAEMKQRFKNKLIDSLSGETGKLTQKELMSQVDQLTDSQISTIDAFAALMVRRYFEVAEVDPNFRIADSAEIKLIEKESIDEIFEEEFLRAEEINDTSSEEFLELIDLYGGKKNHQALKDLVQSVLDFFNSLAYPEEWLKNSYLWFDSVEEGKLLNDSIYKEFFNEIQKEVDQAIENYQLIKDDLNDIPFKKNAKYKSNLESEIEQVLNLKEKTIMEILEALNDLVFYTVQFPKNMDEESKEYYKDLRKSASDNLKALKKRFSQFKMNSEEEHTRETARYMKRLGDLVLEVKDRIQEKKQTDKLLDFTDLERTLLKILQDEKTQEDIKNSYDYIFLDEFQDTNQIQEEIVKQIERGDNRFMVGDAKQSIYHFRNADPSILIDKYDTFNDPNYSQGDLITLNKNFRSSPEIIEFINSIFERIMSRDLGDILYDESAKMVANKESNQILPKICLLTNQDQDDNEESGKLNSDIVQARFIAKKIKELVNDPEQNINYSDIGILFRSIKSRAKTIIQVLSEEGIPVVYNGDAQRIDAIEIKLFLRFLNLIDNHKQDLPLLSILNLPLFGFTLDDFIKIRKAFPDETYFYKAVENYRDLIEDQLASKLKIFYSKLDSYREMSKHLEIDDFLWELLLDSGFYDFIGSLPDGKERKHNLRILLERAKSYRNSSLKGLSSFLQYVERLNKKGENLTGISESAESENAVNLMTIHKSKGLEFPVVFLGDLSRRFRHNTKKDFIFHKDLGFGGVYKKLHNGVILKYDTLLEEIVRRKNIQEELSEEMRVLYVALTRAQDQLYLVGVVPDLEKRFEKWSEGTDVNTLSKMNNNLDWIMTALTTEQNAQSVEDLKDNDLFDLIVEDARAYQEFQFEPVEEVQEDTQDYKKLKETIFSKLNEKEIRTENKHPIKMSVSRIKQHGIDDDEVIELEPLRVDSSKSELKASEIGTATHTLMQYLDLSQYIDAEDKVKEIIRQKDLLVQKGAIEPEAAQRVDELTIEDFFQSDLGKRLIQTHKEDQGQVLKEMSFSCDMLPSEIGSEADFGDRPLEITGVVDCCFIEDGKWILIDYKTDRYYNPEIWRNRILEYTLQTRLYAKALERLTGIPVKEKHVYFLTERQDHIIP